MSVFKKTMENGQTSPPSFLRSQSLESGDRTTTIPLFQRRLTTDGARHLRDNLNSVIREIQPLVETARTVNAGVQNAISITNFLQRPSEPTAQPSQRENSFVINLEDVPVSGEAVEPPNNNVDETVEHPPNPEVQQFLQVVLKYVPFVIILLIKVLLDYYDAVSSLLVLVVTFAHSNATVKKEATKRDRRDITTLFIELFYIFGCSLCVHFFFTEDFHGLLNLTVFKEFTKPLTIGYLLWIVIITDFMLKLITIIIKICLTILPGKIVSFQKRGKIYLFIEAFSQFYRSIATIQPWLSYILDSYQGIGKILSVFLSAFYMISKGSDVMSKILLVKKAFHKLLQNVAVGSSPSKEQIQVAGEHCPICHDEYETPVLLQCRHIFCENCVTTWFDREQTCPLCRAKIVDDPSWRDGSTSYFVQLY